jgi:hypothetical protein
VRCPRESFDLWVEYTPNDHCSVATLHTIRIRPETGSSQGNSELLWKSPSQQLTFATVSDTAQMTSQPAQDYGALIKVVKARHQALEQQAGNQHVKRPQSYAAKVLGSRPLPPPTHDPRSTYFITIDHPSPPCVKSINELEPVTRVAVIEESSCWSRLRGHRQRQNQCNCVCCGHQHGLRMSEASVHLHELGRGSSLAAAGSLVRHQGAASDN